MYTKQGEVELTHAVTFIETSIFTKQIDELATDDELKDFQIELIEQPEKAVLERFAWL